MTFGDLAVGYYRDGVNVLPIIRGTKRPPAGLTWARWQQRRQTESELGLLVERFPGADIAVILGAGSGNLLDIETDGPEGEAALRALRLPTPVTGSWEARRGPHRVYRGSRAFRSYKRLGRGLDVLAAGSYAVVPPSGGRRWIVEGLHEIAPLPAEWEVMLRERGLEERPLDASTDFAGVEEGARNTTLAARVGRWLTQGHGETEILRRALRFAANCVPPLSAAEAGRVVRSILRTRRRTRSPEREALLRCRHLRLGQPATAVYVALVAHHGELGEPSPTFAAPHRHLASLAQVDRDSVGPALRRLETAGLVLVSRGRDPRGFPVTLVDLRPSRPNHRSQGQRNP